MSTVERDAAMNAEIEALRTRRFVRRSDFRLPMAEGDFFPGTEKFPLAGGEILSLQPTSNLPAPKHWHHEDSHYETSNGRAARASTST